MSGAVTSGEGKAPPTPLNVAVVSAQLPCRAGNNPAAVACVPAVWSAAVHDLRVVYDEQALRHVLAVSEPLLSKPCPADGSTDSRRHVALPGTLTGTLHWPPGSVLGFHDGNLDQVGPVDLLLELRTVSVTHLQQHLLHPVAASQQRPRELRGTR